MESKNFFPMYKRCDGANVLVFGAGEIAYRRVRTLLEFNLNITVIAPEFNEKFEGIRGCANLSLLRGKYETGAVKTSLFVLACTDDKIVNEAIADECFAKNIDVSVASNKEKCTFYFPYIINTDDVTVAVVGGGQNHAKTKAVGDEIKKSMQKL